MIIPLLTCIKKRVDIIDLSMETFYHSYNISRQGYYQAVNRQNMMDFTMAKIKIFVDDYRLNKDRRAGSRVLYKNLNIKSLFGIGVTKFESMMSAYGLTLQPLRIRVVTTQSSSQSWNYTNLTNGLIVNDVNQLVVGDITYISLGRERYYLFCLIDYFSLRIVGYCFSNRMRKEEAVFALKMFIDLRGYENLIGCIHHTDGGKQYFSKLYHSTLGHIKISVAQNCLENGLAEQKNGYIKNHLIPTIDLNNSHKFSQEIDRIIYFYNEERKQANLGWLTPVEFEESLKGVEHNKYVKLHDFQNKIPSESHRF